MRGKTNILGAIAAFLVAIIIGAVIYSGIEGWRFLDSLYFTVMTITTIGFGDFVPITDAGKIFTIFFSFFGIAAAFYFLGLISREVFRKHVVEQVSMIKREVKKEEEVKEGIKEVVEATHSKRKASKKNAKKKLKKRPKKKKR